MTYAQVDNLILNTFGNLPLINSVTNNSLDWNIHKDTKYPAVAADLVNVTVDEDGNATYNYNFTAAMIGVESEVDRIRNYSTMMQVLYDGLEELRNNDEVELPDNCTFQFGSLKYMDVLDCATCTVNIITTMEADCE